MKMINTGKGFYGLLLGAVFTIGMSSPSGAHAGIIGISGQLTVIPPPASVATTATTFSNGVVYVFPEQTALALSNALAVDISQPGRYTNNSVLTRTTIPASTLVNSTYLHHAGSGSASVTGSLTFDTDVIGIICITNNLITSRTQLAAQGTSYVPTSPTVGYELGLSPLADQVILSSDRRTVTVTTFGGQLSPDDLRIITSGQAPIISPTANAGTNQSVNPSDLVTLNGTASFDPNIPAQPLTYAWTELSGIPVVLSDASAVQPTFTAPAVPPSGAVLVFQLVVSNGKSTPSTNSVNINVNGVNHPPTANAGPNQTVGEDSVINLDGSGSSDPDSDSLTYQWSQVSGPLVSLTGADTVNPSFISPDVTHSQGSVKLVFTLTVNDGQVSSGPSTVTIIATNINDAPIANAGSSQTVNELQSVTLNGSASSDPDGNPLTYSWAQILGTPVVTLTGANTATPSFIAPQLGQVGTNGGVTLTFQLTVSDGITNSSSMVNVRINKVNHMPYAYAGPDQTVLAGTLVTLDGSGSSDVDGDPLTYSWQQVPSATVTLSNADTVNPTFVAPTVGPSGTRLTFSLTVNDGNGGITNDFVGINVVYSNHPPIVSAGPAQTVNEGDVATLAGSASDPDGNTLVLGWTQISGPTVTLSDPSSLAPGFVAPLVTRAETNLVFQLTADDGFGGISSDTVTIHIANINHPPVAQAPANMTVPEGSSVSLVGQGTDPDTEEQNQLTYAWTQTGGPIVDLSSSGPDASFTAPLITAGGDPNAQETLTFTLTVTDPNGVSDSSSVQVLVANVNHTPTAVVGNNLTVNENSSVTLNGSASSDPDSDPLTYSWVQTAGPSVTLSNANTAYPQFIAPFVNAAGATLQFQLTVSDGFGGSNSAVVTVTVNNINDPPNADHAQPSISTLWPPDGSMVKVSINGIIDPNNNDTITITSVTQDEPTNGLGDGDTSIDAVINNDGTVLLRAERAGGGNGRVYHIHFTAADFEGSASGVVTVSVPHDKKSIAIDDGEHCDSTQ